MTALRVTGNTLATSAGRLQTVTGVEEIAQKITISLQLVYGEWVLDAEVGVPWFERVFIKNPTLGDLQLLFTKAILAVPGVRALDSLTLDLDSKTRALKIALEARSITGEAINLDRSFTPFSSGVGGSNTGSLSTSQG